MIAVAKIGAQGAAQPIAVLLDDRLVETVELAHRLDILVRGLLAGDGQRRVGRQMREGKGQAGNHQQNQESDKNTFKGIRDHKFEFPREGC